MKRNVLILFLSMFSICAKADIATLCDEANKVMEIVRAMPNVTPHYGTALVPTPVPIIVAASFENDGAFFSVCKMVKEVEHLKGEELRALVATEANRLTGNKFNAELDLFLETNSLASTTGAHSLDPKDPAFFKTISTARRFDNLLISSQDYYNSKYNKNQKAEDKLFVSKVEREARVNELATAAYNINSLKKEMACPDEEQRENFDQDYIDYYAKNVSPKHEAVLNSSRQIEELRTFLVDMGVMMYSEDINEYKEYIRDINNFQLSSFRYASSIEKKRAKSAKSANEMGFVNVNYQRVLVKIDKSYLTKILKKYDSRWQEVMTQVKFSSSFGLLNSSGQQRETRQFQRMNPECTYSAIEKKEVENGIYEKYEYNEGAIARTIEEKVNKCIEANSLEPIELFKAVVNDLFAMLKVQTENQAGIWTQESFHFGVMRNFEDTTANAYAQQEVSCSNSVNKSAHKLRANQLKAEENRVKSIIAQGLVERSAMKKAQLDKEKKEENEAEIRQRLEKEQMNREIDNRMINVPRMAKPPRSF